MTTAVTAGWAARREVAKSVDARRLDHLRTATAAGRAAVAVVRISGPATRDALTRLAGRLPPARHATVRTLRDEQGQTLDTGLVLWFPGPASYTGEDAGELHLHGGLAVVDGVLAALSRTPTLRLAEAGEFTRRAFEHGKLDLTQVEAVADLIDAETVAQRQQALDQLGGALSKRHEVWRALFLETLAWLEASVDFPDEDLPELLEARVAPTLDTLREELSRAVEDAPRGQRLRDGYRIALIGAPNAGKSTLLNALVGREAAIVAPTPGTTRDVIEVPLLLAGYRAIVADTAGLRAGTDAVEREGVRRAEAWARAADLRLGL
jgi:tRNA modification GTPase